MKKQILAFVVAIIALVPFTLKAQTYVADKTIPLTGDGGYDYLAIDKTNKRLYISHGTQVNVIDLATDKEIGTIDNMKGVHGIAIVNKLNRGFIIDDKSNAVAAFDIKTLKTITVIQLTDANGPDAIRY